MSYQVLARKWRPRRFEDMVGQEHVLRALTSALDAERLHHAYLFTGTRGVGKTTVARIFAKALNCEKGIGSHPCGECSACRAIDEGRFVDLIEVDAASRTGVDDTRDLLENVQYAPSAGRYKVYLIDEVHMFSKSSFNALLKTLEEPPPHVKFLLATTDPQKLPVTVLSRCLQFHLKALPRKMIHARLAHVLGAEGVSFDDAALQLLARAADGSLRDALSLLDQAIAYGQGIVDEEDVGAMLGLTSEARIRALMDALVSQDTAALFTALAQLAQGSPDYAEVLAEILGLLHAIAIRQLMPEADAELFEASPALVEEFAPRLTPDAVQLFYQIALHGRRDLPLAPSARIGLEMTLLRMLAFMPADQAGSAPSRMASGPMAAQLTRIAPSSTPASQPRKAPQVAISEPLPQVATPVAQSSSVPQSASETPDNPVATLDAAAWHQLLPRLGLGGMALQLAENCEWVEQDGSRVSLRCPPSHASLRSSLTEESIRKALAVQLNLDVRLSFVEGAPTRATPAQVRQRHVEARQEEALESMRNDPLVRALEERVDARLLQDSVRPL
ncbi:MAG: DNA polymerase III subunit gamma/tau [Pseudomonadota bacterium]